MSVRRFAAPDAPGAAEACAHHILSLLEAALSDREIATLAVSGGSTPKLLFQRLAASRFHWDRVHIFWVDERCVPPTDPASNYKLTEDYLLSSARIPSRQVHRIAGEIAPAASSERYAREIRAFFNLDAGEMPHFDVVQLGLGPDGHTASLFPGDALIEDREAIAGHTFVPKFKQWRVTLMPAVLIAARHTVFLVAGEDKTEAVRAVFQDTYDPSRHPAQLASQHGREVAWFLDQKAAALLD